LVLALWAFLGEVAYAQWFGARIFFGLFLFNAGVNWLCTGISSSAFANLSGLANTRGQIEEFVG
jgi:hypothetical protein